MEDRRDADLIKNANGTLRWQVFYRPRMMIAIGIHIRTMQEEGDKKGLESAMAVYGVGLYILSILASYFDQRHK